jgi:DNA polymerase-3 subunit alpha
MSFVHLHRHSEFSRLDGLGTAQQYATRAAEMSQGALALTDHGTLSGALHHIAACKKSKIIPITGVEAYFRPDRKMAKRFKQREAFHLCLFAKNLKGWHSLLKIVSTAFQEVEDGGGFYQYPCVDWELLKANSEGLVAPLPASPPISAQS